MEKDRDKKFLSHFKHIWAWLFGLLVILTVVVYLPKIFSGVEAVFQAALSLIVGAMVAFILNLIMDPVTAFCEKSHNSFIKKQAATIGMFSSILITLALFVAIIWIVVPNLYEAIKVLNRELPTYLTDLKAYLVRLVSDNEALKNYVDHFDVSWQSTLKSITAYFSKGAVGIFDSTIDILTSLVSAVYNLFIVVVFAIFVLGSKPLFIKTYHLLCRLYLSPRTAAKTTRDLRILNSSYKAFVVGSLIQAIILIAALALLDFLFGIPYALMVAVIVGVINIIPMVGAFIGGGIAAFIIFTVSPVKCVEFLIILLIVQQISSNVLYPRIIGDRVGLPGIYVMITIVIGGALFGVAGMILGVPLVATIYRIIKLHLEEKADRQGSVNDPLVRQLHQSNLKLNESLQKIGYESALKMGVELIDIERSENQTANEREQKETTKTIDKN